MRGDIWNVAASAVIFASLRCPKCGAGARLWSVGTGMAKCQAHGEWKASRPVAAGKLEELADAARERAIWKRLHLGNLADAARAKSGA